MRTRTVILNLLKKTGRACAAFFACLILASASLPAMSPVMAADKDFEESQVWDPDEETEEEAVNRSYFGPGDPTRLYIAKPVRFGNFQPIKMLWLGDSIINRYEMAWQFAELCDQNGIKLYVKVYAEDEASLREHLESDEEMDELENGNYDFVLLQEESHDIRDYTDRTIDIVNEMLDLAPDSAQFYLYETASYRDQSERQPLFHDKYEEVGEGTGVPVLYIGDAFQEVIKAHPGEQMYDNLQHPSGFGYSEIIKILYSELEDVLKEKYGELNPGSMTFAASGMEGMANLGGALYSVRDSKGREAGAFITDDSGIGYAAEKEENGENYIQSDKKEVSLPSLETYTLTQLRPPSSGAYLTDSSEILNEKQYTVRAREIIPVSTEMQINRDFLKLKNYRISFGRMQFSRIEALTQFESNVAFSSSNPNIIKVGENGIVTALSPGTAIVTATAENGIFRKCLVEVKLLERDFLPPVDTAAKDSPENAQD